MNADLGTVKVRQSGQRRSGGEFGAVTLSCAHIDRSTFHTTPLRVRRTMHVFRPVHTNTMSRRPSFSVRDDCDSNRRLQGTVHVRLEKRWLERHNPGSFATNAPLAFNGFATSTAIATAFIPWMARSGSVSILLPQIRRSRRVGAGDQPNRWTPAIDVKSGGPTEETTVLQGTCDNCTFASKRKTATLMARACKGEEGDLVRIGQPCSG